MLVGKQGLSLKQPVSTDLVRGSVGVITKIKDMVIQSHLQWYGHVICQDINCQIQEVMELEITERSVHQGNCRKSV